MKQLVLVLTLSSLFLIGRAQDFGQIISGSIKDANTYANEYLRPFGESEIYNQSRGWYSTARAHKRFGFDISASVQFAAIPAAKESFVFNNADYTTFKLNSGTSAALPTLMGGNTSTQINVSTTANGQNVTARFTAPKGIGDEFKKNISFVPLATPLPVLQAGLGLGKHTDLKVRYFPKTSFSDVEIGVFGLAVQHEFSDYLPFIKKVPFLHLAGVAGYTSTTANYKPVFGSSSAVQSSNASANYKISAFTLQGIASVKFSLLEVYTAVGFSSGKSTIDMAGDYTITYDRTPPATGKETVKQTDPVSLSFTGGGISNTWGVRLNLFILKVYADYTFANYNGLGIGAAIAFR